MSKHTPGPWRLDRIPTSWRVCDPSRKSARGPRLIAYAPHIADDAEANARLIAAAPELLKELQALVSLEADGRQASESAIDYWERARAAIDAARSAT